MKIAVIGAGSTYTPELVSGLVQAAGQLGLEQLALMDIDPERLRVVAGFCRRLVRSAGGRFSIDAGADLQAAIDGAGFVLTQIRVGGQAARHRDIQLGLRHGLIGQETTGVGGFAKALRTIPVLLELCRHMERRCPRAWLINFTNPSGLVTEALLRHGRQRVIGLCNIPINVHHDLARLLQVEPERVEVDSLGLNHLSWVRRVRLDGRDVLPQMLEKVLAAGRPANLDEELDYPPEFLRALGMVPSSYLRYYYLTRQEVARLQARPRSRAEEVTVIERRLLDYYADADNDTPPAELAQRGGALYSTAALELMLSLHLDRGDRQVLDVRNSGSLDCLPADCVVEAPCRVSAAGAVPLPAEPVPPHPAGLIQQVKAYELLAVEAAVRHSRAAAILALAGHPLVADAGLAVTLVNEIARDYGIDLQD